MKSTRKIVLMLIVVPVLTLGAGVVAGMLASRLPAARSPGMSVEQRTFIGGQLDLTSDQNDQMRQIWVNAQAKMQRTFEQAEEMQSQREEALIALLTNEQKAKFETISKDFAARRTELDKNRDKAFQDAVSASKALMNESQLKKYDQILSSHMGTLGNNGPKTNG